VIAVSLAVLLAIVLVGLGVTLIRQGVRARAPDLPRWLAILPWVLGIELTLAGVALITVLAYAWVVYAQTV
jgi:hypothetical protein